MKKKLLILLLVFLAFTKIFALEVTIKGGQSFGLSNTYTDSSNWNDGLSSSGGGRGFYFGIDFGFSEDSNGIIDGGIYVDVPIIFNDEFKYDGCSMSGGGTSYVAANLAFGVYANFFSNDFFLMYAGGGVGIGLQYLRQTENAEYYDVSYDYCGVGLNLKLGFKLFPIKYIGIDVFVSDSIEFSIGYNDVEIDGKKYDMVDDFSVSNFFNFNIAIAIRFGK